MRASGHNSEERPLALVILAAGASRRLGTCKALVPLGGGAQSAPLARLLRAGAALQPSAILILSGKHHGAIAAFQDVHPSSARLLHNPAWDAGRSGGIRLAHEELPGHDLCLAPVDVPLVPASVFRDLGEAWRRASSPAMGWLAPLVRLAGVRRHGHPIVIGRALLEHLQAGRSDMPLRELRGLAKPLWELEVDQASILDNLDDAADLRRLRAKLEP